VLKAVVYADSSGTPGALLGVSNQVTVTAGQPWGWVDFTFPAQIPIQSGRVWLGYIAGGTSGVAQGRYDSVTDDLRFNVNAGGYAAGPSNPFGAASPWSFHASIYATYIPSGGGGNNPPVAVATGSPTSGSTPLTVNFDGSGSYDPDAGDTLSYSWDLNGDGVYGDSTAAKPSYTYTSAGTYNAKLKVTDNHGASTVSASVTVNVTQGGTSTFGTTTPGSVTDTATANDKWVSKFTAPQAGSLVKVTGYISGLGAGSGTQVLKAVVYGDSSGSPGTLLGVSNQVTVTAGQPWGWVDFTFPAQIPIQSGRVWIGYIAGGTSGVAQGRYDSVTDDLRFNVNAGGYAAGPSNPFGAASSWSFHASIYATYVPAGSNQPPVPTISSPASTLTWKVGDLISFSGSATDPQDGTLPASALSWQVLLHHCDTPSTCHVHALQSFTGVASGSFNAPDHSWPSYLELVLTATDSKGLSATASVSLQPRTANLTFASAPAGLQLVFDGTTQAAPYTVTAIIGSTHSISAPTPQTLGGTTYTFSSWSDAGAATHNITAPATDTTYTATYTASGANNPPTAVATASPTSGTAPLTVNFDGSGSSDPDTGDTISYSWDLNGDGTFGDSTAAKPSYIFSTAGTYKAVLKVTDNHGASTTSSPVTITVTTGTTSTFGTTTPGSLSDGADANYKSVSKFTAPNAGNVVKVTGYVSGLGNTSGSQSVRAVLYANSSGVPGALLGVSNEVTIPAQQAWGWVDFAFPSPVAIQAGTVWIGYINGGSTSGLIQFRYGSVLNDLRYNTNPYSSGPSNPFGTATIANLHYSIYATYGP
jgi:PKD repeat protein